MKKIKKELGNEIGCESLMGHLVSKEWGMSNWQDFLMMIQGKITSLMMEETLSRAYTFLGAKNTCLISAELPESVTQPKRAC